MIIFKDMSHWCYGRAIIKITGEVNGSPVASREFMSLIQNLQRTVNSTVDFLTALHDYVTHLHDGIRLSVR